MRLLSIELREVGGKMVEASRPRLGDAALARK